jgi:hypothetical protein
MENTRRGGNRRAGRQWTKCSALAAGAALIGCSGGGATDGPEEVQAQEQAIWAGDDSMRLGVVAIQTDQCESSPHHCAGLLISPTVVATAAHCLYHPKEFADAAHKEGVYPTGVFRVAIGCRDLGPLRTWPPPEDSPCPLSAWTNVVHAEVYPGYQYHGPDDIGLLHLETPTTVRPTRLLGPGFLSTLSVGDMVTTYGWGLTEALDLSRTQLTAQMPISDLSEKTTETGWPTNDDRTGPANGDSGTPFLVQRDGEWLTIGPYSGSFTWGRDAHADSFYYPAYFDWITSPDRFAWDPNRVPDLPPQALLPAAQIMAVLG